MTIRKRAWRVACGHRLFKPYRAAARYASSVRPALAGARQRLGLDARRPARMAQAVPAPEISAEVMPHQKSGVIRVWKITA
jgi:hypothetical protein